MEKEREGERERGMDGEYVTAMSFLISEFSLAFNPPPRNNKSWHLFVTYDCISDCLGRDSIPTPRSAGDGGIARVSDGKIEGFVAQMRRSLQCYLWEIWRPFVWVCVCVFVCVCVWMEGYRKSGMCCRLLDVLLDIEEWIGNHWVPPGIHLFTSPFAGCWSCTVSRGTCVFEGANSHPPVFPRQIWGISPWNPWGGFLRRWSPVRCDQRVHMKMAVGFCQHGR